MHLILLRHFFNAPIFVEHHLNVIFSLKMDFGKTPIGVTYVTFVQIMEDFASSHQECQTENNTFSFET